MEEVNFRIKKIRKQEKMTLKDMSEKTGFSISFLSQMERGISPITLTSLKKITTALGIPMKSLFEETEDNHSIEGFYQSRQGEDLQGIQRNYKQFQIVSGRFKNRAMDGFKIVMEAHSTGFETSSHEGEEFYYILQGRATFIIDDREYQVEAGHSIHYPSRKIHTVQNRENGELVMLCVVTPLLF